MYETFFELQHRPFPSVPASDYYMPFETIESARATIERVIDRAEGPALVMAPAGMGKTLLCHLIAKRFHEEFCVAILANTKLCSRRALLQNILFELNLPFRDMEEGELRLSLLDYLEPEQSTGRGLLLIVDEAHTVPLPLLEELRLITNFVRNGEPRVRLLLAGSAGLEERFAHPKMASFQQRVAARCYLHSLDSQEVREYVQGQLFRAGPGRVNFTDEAYRAVHSASDGIPRLVNQICDHALLLASAGGVLTIDAAGIEEAWADLQQLPTPWTADESQQSGEHFIEFGTLDDEGLGDFSTTGDELAGSESFEGLAENSNHDLPEVAIQAIDNANDGAIDWPETDAGQTELIEPGEFAESEGAFADVSLTNLQAESHEFANEPVEVHETEHEYEAEEEQLPETDLRPSLPVGDAISEFLPGTETEITWLGQDIASLFSNFSCVVGAPTANLNVVESLLAQAISLQSPAEGEPAITSVTPEPNGEHASIAEENVDDIGLESQPDVIPLATDPFGGSFSEETMVFEARKGGELLWANSPSVSSAEGRALRDSSLPLCEIGTNDAPATLETEFDEPSSLDIPNDEEHRVVLPFHGAWNSEVDGDLDTELDDELDDEWGVSEESGVDDGLASHTAPLDRPFESELSDANLANGIEPTPSRTVAVDLSHGDDRDLLIVENCVTDIVVTAPIYEPMAERCEYPQLFDKLRQEQ
jgi:type II secretory pathway predicted ATPase ExeA